MASDDGSDGKSGKMSTGIQSVEVGAALLKVLVAAEGPMPLTKLAAAAAMPPGKAHKYLASFTRIGLVARDREGLRYDLGPFALELGLASIRRGDAMTLAQDAINQLRDELGTTASVAVWANRGTTLVRWAETPHIRSPTIRLGTVLPILLTATGQVFGAHLDPWLTRESLEHELADPSTRAAKPEFSSMEAVQARFASIREQGFAFVEGTPEPGRSSVSAPIFSANNDIVAALAIVGIQGMLDVSPDGKPVQALLTHARQVSARLGARLS